MRRLVCALGLAACALPALAQDGALEQCYAQAQQRTQVTPCLLAARKAATDTMLERAVALRGQLQSLAAVTGRDEALRRLIDSQRDFERYLHSQCSLVVASVDTGTGAEQAGLACEVDLLRARAATLAALLPTTQ